LSNRLVAPLLAGVAPSLLTPPVNVLRLSLHPDGLAPRILNHAQWREHLMQRLARQIEVSGDPQLAALLVELREYPQPAATQTHDDEFEVTGVIVPFQLAVGDATLAFFSTTTIFGSPVDVTLAEIAIESFFPADDATMRALEEMAVSAHKTES